MKTENIVWGLVLVFVGSVLLLDNFDVIEFHWRNVWRLWPMILVLSGANIIFSSNTSKIGSAVSIVVTVAALGFIAYYGMQDRKDKNWVFNEQHDDHNDHDDNQSWNNSTFAEPFVDSTVRARLNISGGATVYNLEDTTSNLFDADVQQHWGKYSLQKVSEDSLEVVNFKMSSNKKSWNFGDDENGNEVNMRLNSRPLWDIYVETGAGKTEFDLTRFKIRNLQFKGGAASFEVKLGEPESVTDVLAETGMAELHINVPSNVGCKIDVNSGLSSKDFDGFTQLGDGTYVTSNYGSSSKKINISLKGGLSDFEVNRY